MIKKALPMLFLQTTMINLLLTKFSGPKHHALALTGPIFVGFCVCHTYLSGGGGGAVAKAAFPPPHPYFSLQNPSLMTVGRFAYTFVAFQPIDLEIKDFKNAVSVRGYILLS
jgi:hypothetical protein